VTSDRLKQIDKLVQAAMERASSERAEFLNRACGDDESLRREVESLLAYQTAAGSSIRGESEEATEVLAETQAQRAPGQKLGPYRIINRLGAGGMGEVYLAQDSRLGRKVALKMLPSVYTGDRDRVRRFTQEARAASALNHPNIITIFEIGQIEGEHFIATEFVDGQTLRQRMNQGRMTVLESLDVIMQVASALAAAHEAGIIHRDIKPENVMLRRDGYVKVLDFGLAKLTERPATSIDTSAATLGYVSTQPGMIMGTVAYMSPEQARGLEVDARTDIFSLGVMSYELLTGQRPFTGATSADVISAILNAEPLPINSSAPGLPASLEEIINNTLRKDREERYQTSRVLLDELKSLKRRLELQEELARANDADLFATRMPTTGVTAVLETVREPAAETAAGASAGTISTAEVLLSEIKRHKLGVAIFLIALVIAVGVWFYWRKANLNWAKAMVPRIEELQQSQQLFEAYDLAVEVRQYLPDDPALVRVMSIIADELSVITDPPGARVYLKRFAPDASGNFPQRQLFGTTPINHQQIARGSYILSIEKEGYAKIERSISGSVSRAADLMMVSPPIRIQEKLLEAAKAPDRMVFVPGGDYRLVSWERPTEARVRLDDYFIDKYEVSNREYKEFINAGGYLKRDFWRHPFVKAGQQLGWEEAMREFTDRTGMPGPRSWSSQNFPEGKADHPVTDITWYEAAAYAAFRGKQLPTVFQWEKAARNGAASFAGLTMPWGFLAGPLTHRANFKSSGTLPVDSMEFGMSPFGCFNMAGNVSEWCLNQRGDGFVASGGSWDDLFYLFGFHGAYPGFYSSNKLGFRCVKIAPGPASGTSYDQGAMRLSEGDIPSYTPVSEPDFKALLSHYRYEKTPLEAQVIESSETAEWRREKIAYIGAGGDRAFAYLYLPKNFPKPFQVIHFLPPGGVERGVYTLPGIIEASLAPFIKSGRAVFGVSLKGYLERKWPDSYTAPSPASVEFLEQTLNWVTDLRRGLDYLETRGDVDADKIAYMGPSAGGFKMILPAVDLRYRSILLTGASVRRDQTGWIAGANPINFVSRILAPKLMLHGRYDEASPYRTEGEPLYRLLREPKRLLLFDGGHIPGDEILVPAVNNWFDETMGTARSD
jgi:serine/threonine protein kinase/formylglycine-generating enzyme required for sulfatase activity